MKNKLLYILLSLALSATAYSQTEVNSARQIINNTIEASGGEEYLKTIKSLHKEYSFQDGETTGILNWDEYLPNIVNIEIIVNDSIYSKIIFDGQISYEEINGVRIESDPEVFQELRFKRNIFEELDYLSSELWEAEYLGEDKIRGEEVYKVSVKSKLSEITRILYYNKSTYYLIMEVEFWSVNSESYTMTEFLNYKKFENLTTYTIMRIHDGSLYNTFTLENLKIN